MKNLYELSDQDLDTAGALAEAKHDDRSLPAILAEIKRRQEQAMTAAQYAHPIPMTGTPLITDAETDKQHRW